MIEFFNTIIESAPVVFEALAFIIAGFSIIAKLTPTPKDDAVLSKVTKVVDIVALNVDRTKTKEKLTE